jgi:exonuclease SbcC
VIRLNGRRKTEAYLHVLDDAGRWSPVRLDDGLVSDGKVDTYNRCIEAICGSADTFFTSVFSAQGKRQLSTYRNAEIKTLLSDLLGQDEIRALGHKASETAKLLKAGLLVIRQELTGLDAEQARIVAGQLRLRDASARVQQALADRQSAQAALDADRSCHARLVAERDQSQSTDARRAQLLTERKALIDTGTQAINALKLQDQGEAQRLERLEQHVTTRLAQERNRRAALIRSRSDCLATLDVQDAVRRAGARLPLAEHMLALRDARIAACRQRVAQLTHCQGAERLLTQKLTNIEQEAGRAVFREQELAHRFGLVGEVPCVGTDLQGQCKLLGDAREARAMIPSAKAQIVSLAADKAAVLQELDAVREQRDALASAPQALALAEHRVEVARARASRFAMLAAKAVQIEQARLSLLAIDTELAALGIEPDSTRRPETADEQSERQQIMSGRQHIAQQLARQAQHYRDALDRLDGVLAALPAPFDAPQLEAAAQALNRSGLAVTAAEQAHLVAERDAQTLVGLTEQVQALMARRAQVEARMSRVEDSLGAWNLFARCMSNDGLIALAIDDAGPALSGLANDLLLACYGPRFTVSILTLVETGKGEQREGFDILVHDGESGDSKSVGLMSGGERVWVNECLTRAVALYLAQHSGRSYDTLFSDEADGALDPERKRMFMAMKREVLRLGGYRSEFYVSQTPELTAMADVVIDLDAMVADGSLIEHGARSEDATARQEAA